MKQFCLLIATLCLFITQSYSQGDALNLEKYWKYRLRLLGNQTKEIPGFVNIGPNQGQSLPAEARNPNANCINDWAQKHDTCQLHPGNGKMVWSDGTTYLGFYIAVLSTEYALRRKHKHDLKEISQELSWALDAYIRVDKAAEPLFKHKENYDGFFVRSDVPGDFCLQDPPPFPGYSCVYSEYACGVPSVIKGRFNSQDQCIYLLLGLAFVKKFVPPDAKDSQGNLILAKAQNIAHTMVSFLKENNWNIKDPRGVMPPNKWGGSAAPYSFQIAKAAQSITGGQYRAPYQNRRSRQSGELMWQMVELSFGFQYMQNRTMFLSLAAINNELSPNKCARIAKKSDLEMYALAQAVLHDTPLGNSLSQTHIKAILDSAPVGGPCFGTEGCNAPKGWKASNRWLKYKFKDTGNPYGVHMEWNGLDYMILYNLYHLQFLNTPYVQ